MNTRPTSDSPVDRVIDAWLDLGPTRLSAAVVERTRLELHRTRRRSSRWASWPSLPAGARRVAWSLAIAAVVVVLVGVGLRLLPNQSVGPETTPEITPLPSSSVIVRPLSADGSSVFEGTYTTQFEPALTLTVDKVVEPDCPAASPQAVTLCHGTVDMNTQRVLDLAFAVAHGTEVIIVAPDKVYDGSAQARLIDPPSDLVAWMKSLPGTAVLGPAKAVQVGGIDASAFDVTTPGELQFGKVTSTGFQAGIGPSGLRVIVLTVRGQLVLIEEWLGPDNTVRDGPAALQLLQPLIDSIVWQ